MRSDGARRTAGKRGLAALALSLFNGLADDAPLLCGCDDGCACD